MAKYSFANEVRNNVYEIFLQVSKSVGKRVSGHFRWRGRRRLFDKLVQILDAYKFPPSLQSFEILIHTEM